LARQFSNQYDIKDINTLSPIAATRKAYKLCGKDPNRYRPSQEQMMRRILKGLGLYNVNTLVDMGNLISLKTGCSIGCFDADKIEGDTLCLGIGKEDEPYKGIGRGPLNISGLPVFRDKIGGIGTPTSDNERTKLSLDTVNLLCTVHLFDPEIDIEEVKRLFENYLKKYAESSAIKTSVFIP
ncbi:MAG: hypothetical protein K2L89_06385, partial [Muribaculaceae bacterium]|nr:hypothetical protein [Muribaculaceae bacterium]